MIRLLRVISVKIIDIDIDSPKLNMELNWKKYKNFIIRT